jgi:energy-converting hydrogenase Eha subunit A
VEVVSDLPLAGFVLAFVSVLALTGGFALQQHAASRVGELTLRRPRASAAGLLRARRWVAGFVLGLCGWGLYVAALGRAPLSLVQAVAASGIGVLVLCMAVVHRRRPARREAVGALIATGGLVALGLSLVGAGVAHDVAISAARVAGCALVVACAAWALARRGSAGAVGASAGLCYGLGDVATKAFLVSLPAHAGPVAVLFDPYLGVTLAAHGAGFLLLQHAFRRGGVVAAIAPMTAAMNLLPMAAGVVVLGDALPSSPLLLVLRVAAFAATAIGAGLLAGARELPAAAEQAREDRPAPSLAPFAVAAP